MWRFGEDGETPDRPGRGYISSSGPGPAVDGRVAHRGRSGRGPQVREIALLATAIALTLGASLPGLTAGAPIPSNPSGAARTGPMTPATLSYQNYSIQNYTASTDGWPLSYYEWLPAGYSATRTYPLVVFLHGMQGASGNVSGGLKSGVVLEFGDTSHDGVEVRAILNTSMADGYLVITVNERTGAGWYANSPCAGPQENDTLDAIAHEEALRHVGRVFLMGVDMGATGALALAATHPGMFAGVATAGTITDAFEALAYRQAYIGETTGPYNWTKLSYHTMLNMTCGSVPVPANATAVGIYDYLSVARLDPYALASTPLYVVSGGLDTRAPNNGVGTPFYQVNNSFLTSTCGTVLGEPPNCTDPFSALHNASPSEYRVRDIFEPSGSGSYGQFNASDLFGWFNGAEPSGYCLANGWPPGEIVPTVPQNLQLVGPGPYVAANDSTNTTFVGTPITFSATASGPGGPPYVFTWNFGDGATSTGADVQHVFTAPANYTVTVTVPGTSGNRTVVPLPLLHVEDPLAARIVVSPTPPSATRTAVVTANITGGSGGYGCKWNFGDTRTGTGCSTTHIWAGGGTFLVSLTVNDTYGHLANFTANVTVNGTAPSTTPVSTTPSRSLPPNSLEGGAIVIGVAVLVVLLLRWRRRRNAAAVAAPVPPAAVRK